MNLCATGAARDGGGQMELRSRKCFCVSGFLWAL